MKQLIEESANELGEFDYEEVAGAIASGTPLEGGSAPVGQDRGSHGSEAILRSENCTWENLAKLVNFKMQRTNPELSISEKNVRLYSLPRNARTRTGKLNQQVHDAAQVGSLKISPKDEEWNIDMHQGNASVSYFETEHALLLQAGHETGRIAHDDHSKIEADKKRGYNSRKVVTHRSKRKSAPYSDMDATVKTGGAKVVVNSILVIGPSGMDPESVLTSSNPRLEGLRVHKQGIAVCRLDNDRRSTPMQQFNDLRFAAQQIVWFGQLVRQPSLFFLSDAGWDHSPRVEEVQQWSHTRHHLDYDRDYDAAYVRPKGGSGRSEAENLNCSETIAIAKSGSATASHLGKPTSADEVRCHL